MRALTGFTVLALSFALFPSSARAQCQRLSFVVNGGHLFELESEGDRIVAGFPFVDGPIPGEKNSGRAYVLRRDGAGDFHFELSLSGGDGDFLGTGVALGPSTVFVGAPDETVPGVGVGNVHAYELDGTGTWVPAGSFNPGSNENVGSGVAVHGDWAWIASEDGLGVRLRRESGGWTLDGTVADLGSEVAMDSTHALFTGGGGTHALELVGGSWSLVQTLPAGLVVEVDGDRALVLEAFLLRAYDWNGAQWIETFVADAGADFFWSTDAALSGDFMAVGQSSGELGLFSGRTLVYRRDGGTWKLLTALVDEDGNELANFGTATAFLGDEMITSAKSKVVVVELPAWLSTFCHCDAAPCGNADPVRGCANSTGRGASLQVCGSASASLDDLVLTASLLPPGQPGLVFMGAGQIDLPFGDGRRCVGAGGAGIFRFPVRAADADGRFSEGPGLVAHSQGFHAGGAIDPGETWHFQAWYRDPAGPCGSTFNLSHGLSVPFGP